ncbi:hypothetical protein O181_037420 [Austropuccinia psidii MF-1]|uniref:Leucine carboxyl methyltransferase 1 n=1 Tax=Austropuccinia psidii MF-1 TaxID=1389203 RepID=A0A9Q3DAW3_9BASI|nr:hypothetical protein [Austropuccinia psidii MF-1]
MRAFGYFSRGSVQHGQPALLQSQDTGVDSIQADKMNNTKAAGDQAIRETDIDAAVARFSAVSKGYMHDELVAFFAPSKSNPIRPPWVNVGTHHRTYTIDALIERFIQRTKGPVQVLSLGSGSDSRYWRLRKRWGAEWPVERWIETDFQETVSSKIDTIIKQNQLLAPCGQRVEISADDDPTGSRGTQPHAELHGQSYCLVSIDLRKPDHLISKLTSHHLLSGTLAKPDLPTLILAELVFVYMQPEETQSCLSQLAKYFRDQLMVVTYEALNLGDNFSRVMVQNLRTRGLTLLGFNHNSGVESQLKRFRELGFLEIMSTNMKKLRESASDDKEWNENWKGELGRIKQLEFLDEVEELELILEHYALTWALRKTKSPIEKTRFYLPSLD